MLDFSTIFRVSSTDPARHQVRRRCRRKRASPMNNQSACKMPRRGISKLHIIPRRQGTRCDLRSSPRKVLFFGNVPENAVEHILRFSSDKPNIQDWVFHVPGKATGALMQTSGSLFRVSRKHFRSWFDELTDSAVERIFFAFWERTHLAEYATRRARHLCPCGRMELFAVFPVVRFLRRCTLNGTRNMWQYSVWCSFAIFRIAGAAERTWG